MFLDPDEMAALEREAERVDLERYAAATAEAIREAGGLWRARKLSRWERLIGWLAGD